MRFDPEDPFPLIDLAAVPYGEQKAHAAQVDEWLGFEIETVESAIEHETHTRESLREQRVGLPPQSLQTPYVEFRAMLEAVRGLRSWREDLTIADLGAAYGRLAFVMAAHAPLASFVGLEISDKRVREGRRVMRVHALPRAELRHADLLVCDLPEASVYFLYDFGSLHSIRVLLDSLKKQAVRRPLGVVGRGRATRDEIERHHPWLSQVVPPVHYGNFTLYQSGT